MRIFSGIQPSGELHIGNYLGAIRNWVQLQHQHECIYCVVDYHAITGSYEPDDLRRRTSDMVISLLAAGLDPDRDIRKQSLSVNASVDALKDGKIDAFFWSGGLPTASLLDLAGTINVTAKLIPNDDALPALQSMYTPGLYFRLVIPRGTYPGVASDIGVVGVANALVVDDTMSDDLAYELTKVLFEKQRDLAAIHPEARKLSLDRATQGSPVPFHPGAVRYYRERGAWR